MKEAEILISEAARLVDVETHVLRYWEEELSLPIARNEMGHRYYTRQDIQIFLSIKELKRKGFQLKSIRELIPVMRQELYGGLRKEDKKEQETESAEERRQKFYRILERLLVQIAAADHREARYRRLDAAIRDHQYSRRLVAVTKEQGKKRRRKFLKGKKEES